MALGGSLGACQGRARQSVQREQAGRETASEGRYRPVAVLTIESGSGHDQIASMHPDSSQRGHMWSRHLSLGATGRTQGDHCRSCCVSAVQTTWVTSVEHVHNQEGCGVDLGSEGPKDADGWEWAERLCASLPPMSDESAILLSDLYARIRRSAPAIQHRESA